MDDRNAVKKTCSKCGKEKPADGFYKNQTATDNLTARCKACILAYSQNEEVKAKRKVYRSRKDVKARKKLIRQPPSTKPCRNGHPTTGATISGRKKNRERGSLH
jgi:hypothetical protein